MRVCVSLLLVSSLLFLVQADNLGHIGRCTESDIYHGCEDDSHYFGFDFCFCDQKDKRKHSMDEDEVLYMLVRAALMADTATTTPSPWSCGMDGYCLRYGSCTTEEEANECETQIEAETLNKCKCQYQHTIDDEEE